MCHSTIFLSVSVFLLGLSVATACSLGYYGDNCRSQCSDKCITMECHNVTGACLGGCQIGYTGNTCQEACPSGFYGSDCALACVSTCPNSSCHHETGDCLEDCPPGFGGSRCDEATKLHCDRPKVAHTINNGNPGKTMYDKGDTLVFKCGRGFKESLASPVNEATCLAGGKWSGPKMQCVKLGQPTQSSGCPTGFYGKRCNQPCPSTCANNTCKQTNGHCVEPCPPGYHGAKCGRGCRHGKHGAGCQENCPQNCAKRACHPATGFCTKGCKKNFYGNDCSQNGEFKDNPVEEKEAFYQNLSADSRSVLLYILMSEYDKTLERAQAEIKSGLRLKEELSTLIGR